MRLVSAVLRAAAQAEQDSRTVFTFNLPLRGDEDDVAEFFEKHAGKSKQNARQFD